MIAPFCVASIADAGAGVVKTVPLLGEHHNWCMRLSGIDNYGDALQSERLQLIGWTMPGTGRVW